jgi:antitoxin CcdA
MIDLETSGLGLATQLFGHTMHMNAQPPSRRKATNVSLDEKLVAEAKELGVNVSRACEAGLAAETRQARKRKWVEANREAIESTNAYVEKYGLPLEKYRTF